MHAFACMFLRKGLISYFLILVTHKIIDVPNICPICSVVPPLRPRPIDVLGRLGDVYDFMRFYSISLIDFSLSMISPFLDKRLTAD